MTISGRLILISLIIYLITACSPGITLDLDKVKWKNDHEGCSGYRMNVYQHIMQNKEKLLGLSNKKIIQLMGNPNINELYTRNQKFFIYRVSPAPSCSSNTITPDLFLIFRFNATGLVNEIYLNDESSPTC